MKESIESIIDEYMSSDRTDRQWILKRKSGELMRDYYRRFAFSAATDSVRQNSKELWLKGIYAIIIEDGGNDYRDNIVALTLLYHSGLYLNVDPEVEFKKIADDTDGKGKVQLVSFIERGAELKTLKCMGFRTTREPIFNYVDDRLSAEYGSGDTYSEPTDKKLMSVK